MEKSNLIDLYLLRGGPETDEYSSRSLVCSDVALTNKKLIKRFYGPTLLQLTLDVECGRFSPHLLLPYRTYRVAKGENVSYVLLHSYQRSEDSVVLQCQLL